MPTLSSMQHILPNLCNVAPRPILTLPSPQHVLPTLCNVASRPTPTLPSPQRIRPTLGGVALRPTRPASTAPQPRRPKPSLALQLPVNNAPPGAPHASSSPARIADVQERPSVVVAAKSGRQVGHGGGGGKAIGRWFGLLPSCVREQRVRP